ncbi:MAG: LamG-like jellyroll fold domain-containing protein [Anaerohalosphaeraceae bacterium]
MRKISALLMIILFCVGAASAKTILIISDGGYWPTGAPNPLFDGVSPKTNFYNDTQLVEFLISLGYTVDTSGMAGRYRDSTGWTTDSDKLAALSNADLIIVSRLTDSGQYHQSRKVWNELPVPILCQNGALARSQYDRWGWSNGGNATSRDLNMPIVMGHELVDGFGSSVALFTDIPTGRNVTNPAASALWDAYTSVVGTQGGNPMLVDIPAGTDFDVLCGKTNFFGIAGARRVYFGHWGYDAASTYPWDMNLTAAYKNLFARAVAIAMKPVQAVNNSPAHRATNVPVDLAAAENDLIFTILDSNVSAVDVYLGPENEPNLTAKPQYRIVQNLPVTPGQNTVDLVGELPHNLTYGTDYYWRVLCYEPNAVTGIPMLTSKGPVWKFSTAAQGPVISCVSPAKIGVFPGENVVFSVTGENVETYQWYKEGNPNPLVNGSKYSGVNTDTLTILNAQPADRGFYYCVGMKTGYTNVVSVPSGELDFKELKHHFPFNLSDVVDGKTRDVVGGVWAQLVGGASIGTNPSDSIVGNYLRLENPGPTASDTQYAEILSSIADYPEITISAWVRQDTRDIGCVWDFGQSQERYFTFTMGYKDDQAKVEYRHAAQREYVAVFDRTYDWQFVTITVDSTGMSKTYIDGQFKSSYNLQANLTAISKPINYIGRRIYPNLPKFDGLIDELKVYNYVRSTEQIARDYMEVRTNVPFVCNQEISDLGQTDYNRDCRTDLADLAIFLSRWVEDDRIYRP